MCTIFTIIKGLGILLLILCTVEANGPVYIKDSPFGESDCPNGLGDFSIYQRTCFQFVTDKRRTFPDAERDCASRGGVLVMVKSKGTSDFLQDCLVKHWNFLGELWIGLDDRNSENSFKWSDGSTLEEGTHFANWKDDNGHKYHGAIQHHLEDCVVMDTRDGGLWHDYHCENDIAGWELLKDYKRPYICQFRINKPVPTPTPKPTKPTPPPTTTTPKPTCLPLNKFCEKKCANGFLSDPVTKCPLCECADAPIA